MKAIGLWLGVAIALLSATGHAREGAAARSGAGAQREQTALSLPYAQRMHRWGEMANQGDPAAALALGESVVSESSRLTDRVWTRGRLATQYLGYGSFERARELIAQAAELTASFLFRAAPNGGQAGYAKQHALFELQRAQCNLALRLLRLEEATAACQSALDSAGAARALVHLSGRSEAAVHSDWLLALMDRSRADRAAGRTRAAQQGVAKGSELVASGLPSKSASANFYRFASQMAIDLGNKRQAKEWARLAVDIWHGDGDGQVGIHAARLKGYVALQTALVFGGEWQAANDEFDRIDALTRGNRMAASSVGNVVVRALAYAQAGRLPQASSRLERSAAAWRERLGPDHPATAVGQGLHAASILAGKPDAAQSATARAALTRAAELLLEAQRRGDARDGGIDGLATRFVLEQFLRTRQSNPSPPESHASILAFQVADFMRGSRVQGAIEDAAVRSAATAAGLGDLVRREQDAHNEVRSLQDVMAGRAGESEELPSDEAVSAARQRLLELEASRAALRTQIAKAFPKYDALVHPKLPGTAEVIRQLALGEAFVLMLPVEDGVHLWALTWTDQSYRFAALPPARLAQAVDAIRRSTELGGGPVIGYAHDAAWQLYRELLAPLEKQLTGARHLIVAGGGVLGSVPFAALLTSPPQGQPGNDMPWLARKMAVSQVPGASAWLAIQRLGAGARPDQALLAWGDPTFAAVPAPPPKAAAAGMRQVLHAATRGDTAAAAAPRYADLPALPETRDELLAIAATLQADPDRDLHLGERATRASVLAANASGALATRRVVAFATHGMMAGDLPNLNQPALAMAATADAERDPLAPLLTLDDVLGLKLNADWVVLSACNTAAGDGRAEEALSGLARGFFYAGARSLLVTHWAVETESAMLLTTHTFEHYAANPYAGKAESLRQAMLKVMAHPKFAHPAFWAPYALVGDGAR